MPVYGGLLVDTVVLKFEIKSFLAKYLLVPVKCVARFIMVFTHDRLRNFAGEASAKGNNAFLVFFKQFLVDAGLVVKAFEMCGGCKANQVFVAGFVFSEQQEMVVAILAGTAVGLAVKPAAGCNVHFTANDRLNTCLARGLIKIHRAMHHPVISDGER